MTNYMTSFNVSFTTSFMTSFTTSFIIPTSWPCSLHASNITLQACGATVVLLGSFLNYKKLVLLRLPVGHQFSHRHWSAA
jgi:hypothetical protein